MPQKVYRHSSPVAECAAGCVRTVEQEQCLAVHAAVPTVAILVMDEACLSYGRGVQSRSIIIRVAGDSQLTDYPPFSESRFFCDLRIIRSRRTGPDYQENE